MCLVTVSKRKPNPTGFGWKVFNKLAEELYGQHYGTSKVRPIDKWLKEKDYRGFPEENNIGQPYYPTGWHVFKKKKDAEYWAWDNGVRKVEYKKAHTQGQQILREEGSPNCIVAKEIKILPLKGE